MLNTSMRCPVMLTLLAGDGALLAAGSQATQQPPPKPATQPPSPAKVTPVPHAGGCRVGSESMSDTARILST